jgi:hypothetical protein
MGSSSSSGAILSTFKWTENRQAGQIRSLETLSAALYFNNHALPGSSLARNFARDARDICLDVQVALTGSVYRGFSEEVTECFRASMVLYAEATNQPLDHALERNWADGLSVSFNAVFVGMSVDLGQLINRMFPTPSTRAIIGDNSFIKLQDALMESREKCVLGRKRLQDQGCLR